MSRLRHPRGSWQALFATTVIALAFAAGCGSSDSAGTNAFEATEAAETPKGGESGPTEAVLEPLDGESPTGTARFLTRPQNTPVLQIEAEGLEPAHGASRYMIWIVGNRHDMVSLAGFHVGADGRLSRKIDNGESHSFVEDGTKTELLITKVDNIESVSRGIAEADSPWDPPEIGKPVLHGNFEGALVGVSPPVE